MLFLFLLPICDPQIAIRNPQSANRNTQSANRNTQYANRNTQIANRNTQIAIRKSQIAYLYNMKHNLEIKIVPVAFVKNNRTKQDDYRWGDVISELVLADHLPDECLKGIEGFSHLEILFYFHLLNDADVVFDLRHPRENQNYPLTGIFAQRGRARPNKLGATMVMLVEVKKRSVIVKGLDAIDNTPILDIKPVMVEFLPVGEVRQPVWSSDLMSSYWK